MHQGGNTAHRYDLQLKGPKEDPSSERIFSDSKSPVKPLAAQGLHQHPPAVPPQASELSLPAQKTSWALYFVTLFLAVSLSVRRGQPTGCEEHSSTWLNGNKLQSMVHHKIPIQGACCLEISALPVPGNKSVSQITDSEGQSLESSLRQGQGDAVRHQCLETSLRVSHERLGPRRHS